MPWRASGGNGPLVAIAGATGHAGREILRALARRGVRVRALVRNPQNLGDVARLCDEIRTVHVTSEKSASGFLDGADGLISAVGKTRQRDPIPRRIVDVDANECRLAEAARAGIRRIGFVSVAGAAHNHSQRRRTRNHKDD